jgi:flavin-dependent dehydrogenase
LSGQVELFLLPDGYGGLEPVEGGIANLCVLLRRAAVTRIGPGWIALRDYLMRAAPTLGARLDGGIALWESPLAVVCPSGGHLHESPSRVDRGLYRVGDRIAHIPPFTGDGLGIALASAEIAAAHIRDRRSPDDYHRAVRRAAATPVRLASAVSRIADTSVGRALMGIAASHGPWLLRTIARKTRLAA